jgi:hypothetical protein
MLCGAVLTLPGCVGAGHLLALPAAHVAGGATAASMHLAILPIALVVALADASQDGRCGDDTDCAKGNACMGSVGASIGRCVAVKDADSNSAPEARSSRQPERREFWCDPTQSTKWHGASFEEKERLYEACLTGTVNSPL